MAVTLEQVEKLREKAGLTYEEARQVLEQTGGDLLEALIQLERQGRLGSHGGACYTTRPAGAEAPRPGTPPSAGPGREPRSRGLVPAAGNRRERSRQSSFREQLRELLAAGLDLLRHSTVNQFQVWRKGEMMTSMPVLILILLVAAAFWISVPLLVVGLFFDCKYRFAGPDLDGGKVGETMERVSDSIHGVVDQVKEEFHRAARRNETDRKEK